MSTSAIDLWLEDLRVPDETTPALLLRQQAEVLGQRTKGRVEAEVITQALDEGRLAHHCLSASPGSSGGQRLPFGGVPGDFHRGISVPSGGGGDDCTGGPGSICGCRSLWS